MVRNQVAPKPTICTGTTSPETVHDNFTSYTGPTTPETVAADLQDGQDPLRGAEPSSPVVPWPGLTLIIRSVSSKQVITLLDGQIALTPPDGRGSIYWECVETKGWLGFRNTVSGRFLGHDRQGRLCCHADRHQGWEYFCVRMRPDGGYVLLLQHWERLWHVGIKAEQGVEKLAKIGDGASGGMVWEFAKV